MKTKILSLLFILCLGVGFLSCSKDSEGKTQYEQGKETGTEFYNAYNSAKGNYLSIEGITSLTKMSKCYTEYKNNSEDSQWKSGFLAGATNSDNAMLYPELEDILNSDYSNIVDIMPALMELLN
jgi:hypothetical protein